MSGIGNFIEGETALAISEYFAGAITGEFVVGTAGVYTFGTNSDDGVRLRVNGADVIVRLEFKGSTVGTFQNDKMQRNNVSEDQFKRGTTGFLSGAPMKKITNISGEYGGPILKNRLWFWVAADRQDINAGVVNFFDRARSE